jgi:hypothetical protein
MSGAKTRTTLLSRARRVEVESEAFYRSRVLRLPAYASVICVLRGRFRVQRIVALAPEYQGLVAVAVFVDGDLVVPTDFVSIPLIHFAPIAFAMGLRFPPPRKRVQIQIRNDGPQERTFSVEFRGHTAPLDIEGHEDEEGDR